MTALWDEMAWRAAHPGPHDMDGTGHTCAACVRADQAVADERVTQFYKDSALVPPTRMDTVSGAQVPEADPTEKMLDAGVSAVAYHREYYKSGGDRALVEIVWRAMERERLRR